MLLIVISQLTEIGNIVHLQ